MPAGAHLRSLTVAECNNVTHIDADRASSLRSFRLSSALLPTYDISGTASLDDLYICVRGRNSHPVKQWIKALPNLSNLTVLTICSIALRRVYALARFGSATCLTELRNLPSLRDLQLLMFSMDSTNLAHIYMFFRCCRCPLLEKLFVQLPTSSHDIFMDNFMLVAEEDEPDEELSEEDKPYAELSEEDEPDAELSEEYETEEEVLEEGVSEEYILEERLEYEDVYEEDPSDENMPDEEQSEEGVPGYGLNNVIFAKMINFKGHFFEMRLVSFLLRKATGLKKLLLIAPKGNHMEALRKEPMDTSCFLEAELLRLKNASQNAQIVLSESDPAAIQPMHSDVFAKF
uniref:FBD domain-containing protein n=1 Tax=Arundo donax TaxID=35708 RepID=A0A0A9AVY9_ARUDO